MSDRIEPGAERKVFNTYFEVKAPEDLMSETVVVTMITSRESETESCFYYSFFTGKAIAPLRGSHPPASEKVNADKVETTAFSLFDIP